MINLLILLLIAHFIADFYFQSNAWCKSKEEKGFRSRELYLHGAVVFICTYLLSFSLDFIGYALAISVLHLLADGIKNVVSKDVKIQGRLFFFDQAFHVGVIAAATYIYSLYREVTFPFSIDTKYLLYILGFLICSKPSNIFIKKIFDMYEIRFENQDSLLNAGKLIGTFERYLALTFVLLGQFEAVGFLIAAKSILRYKEGDVKRTEYVLIGTLLSYGIAILTGLAIHYLIYGIDVIVNG